ncbi:MAG: T9SS type A sorting domain-containing protein, partial [Bacteroidetes bacterium]|nr:T9SS type A sorting domain-containing protein [Bacteroidota bacterium]
GLNSSIRLNASTNGDGSVTLKWPYLSFTGTYKIYKNSSGIPLNFTSNVATLNATDSIWKDGGSIDGTTSEYAVVRFNGSGQTTAIGYILAGNKTKEIPTYGGIILLVDSNYIKPLAAELATLKQDLIAGGYIVTTIYAGRNEKVPVVKTRIKAAVDAGKPIPSTLYMIGHIPVPYSGYFSGNSDRCAYPPDGHIEGSGSHTGAWPADVYYGDFEGIWTDNLINYTSSGLARNNNIPGDGKFDQCAPPNDISLQIGRVDLYNMPFYAGNDTLAMKNYLDRAHQWKQDQIAYVERGLVDDNFTSLDLSATGYSILSSCVSIDSVFSNRDYFTYQNKENYLWSYGCGAGSFTNCSGIGGYNNFNPGTFKNIFTALAGSFFGDWDVPNNFLRSPLCAGSLVSFWGGIPKWYGHYFGIGLPIGYSALVTQNEKTQSFNLSENKVHIALMGDPTVTLKSVPPAGKLKAVVNSGHVDLSWGAAKGKFDGYALYTIDTINNKWTRVNTAIITDTFYSDLGAWRSGNYKYAVRPIRLDRSGSGSYYNLGGGTFAWVTQTNSVITPQNLKMSVVPNPTKDFAILQVGSELPADVNIDILDITGKSLNTGLWQKASSREIQLNLSGLSDGVYFVRLSSAVVTGSAKVQIHR